MSEATTQKMTMTRSIPAIAALLLCGAAQPALAQAISTSPVTGGGISQEQALSLTARLDALERQNQALEKQLQELKTQTSASDQAIRKDLGASKTTLANARPTIASADGNFTASFRGMIQLDAARYDQDAAGPLASDFRRGSLGDAAEADRARDFSDGANFRRVRFGLEGKAFGDWDYNFLFDFGGSGVEAGGVINQAWLQYSGLGFAKLKIGAFAPPAGMDDQTSVTQLAFLERSAVSELIRGMAGADARTAVSLLANGERWNIAASVTGNTVGVSSFDEQVGLVGRATYVPFKGKDYLTHIGVNASMIVSPAAGGPDVGPAGAVTNVRLRERAETRVEGVRLIDTGSIDADNALALGLEAAVQYRAFTLQSEIFDIDVQRRTGALADPEFSGWYLQGTWTLTGQPRRYNAATAAFDMPKVEKPFSLKTGDLGVWEIAARYSTLDLDDAVAGIRGGEQDIVTLGLNWQPNNAVRFQANVQVVDVDRLSPGGAAFGAGALTPAVGAQIGQDLTIWSLRSQYAF